MTPLSNKDSGGNVDLVFEKANAQLEKASTWFKANKLTLNVKKTKFMLFCEKNTKVDLKNLHIKIGDKLVEQVGTNCMKNILNLLDTY